MSAKQVVKVTPKLMTELGVVPVLVSMDASMVTHRQEFDPVSSWKLHKSCVASPPHFVVCVREWKPICQKGVVSILLELFLTVALFCGSSNQNRSIKTTSQQKFSFAASRNYSGLCFGMQE